MIKYILFSGPNCPWCVKAKDFLANLGVEYTEVAIKDRDAFMFMQTHAPGVRTIPVLMADREALVGFPAIVDHFNTSQSDPSV